MEAEDQMSMKLKQSLNKLKQTLLLKRIAAASEKAQDSPSYSSTTVTAVSQLTFTLIIKIFNILNNNPPCTSTTVDIILCVWCRSFGARSEYDQDLLVFGFLFLKCFVVLLKLP